MEFRFRSGFCAATTSQESVLAVVSCGEEQSDGPSRSCRSSFANRPRLRRKEHREQSPRRGRRRGARDDSIENFSIWATSRFTRRFVGVAAVRNKNGPPEIAPISTTSPVICQTLASRSTSASNSVFPQFAESAASSLDARRVFPVSPAVQHPLCVSTIVAA